MFDFTSELARNYPESGIRKMFTLAADYTGVINLCNGEPNFDTPEHIIDGAIKALKEKKTRYGNESGLPSLKEAIALKYTKQFGRSFSPNDVMVSAGGVEGIMLSLMAVINPGDEVIIPDPAYVCYTGQVQLLGGKVVRVPLREEHQFRLQPEDLEKAITERTKAIILNYPSNPVGAVLDAEDARRLAQVILKYNIIVISDEVYEKIIFDGRIHYSLAQVPGMEDRVLVVNSFSKTYAMTGWRLGYIISSNQQIMSRISKMQQPLIACLPVFIMEAGADALNGPQDAVEEMVRHYTRRRNLMLDILNKVPGFQVFQTEGTFCVYINIKAYPMTSERFCEMLLSKTRVLTVPGTAFGENGEGYIRMCFANSDENITLGATRIKNYLEEVKLV
jgi:aminotransferase